MVILEHQTMKIYMVSIYWSRGIFFNLIFKKCIKQFMVVFKFNTSLQRLRFVVFKSCFQDAVSNTFYSEINFLIVPKVWNKIYHWPMHRLTRELQVQVKYWPVLWKTTNVLCCSENLLLEKGICFSSIFMHIHLWQIPNSSLYFSTMQQNSVSFSAFWWLWLGSYSCSLWDAYSYQYWQGLLLVLHHLLSLTLLWLNFLSCCPVGWSDTGPSSAKVVSQGCRWVLWLPWGSCIYLLCQ